MAHPLDGYEQAVDYPSRFQRETAPGWLVSVATALGRRAPDVQGAFRWLELGCGDGLGAALTAAGWPQAEVVAVDAHPGHAARARALAAAAAPGSMRVLEMNFETLAAAPDDTLAPCDFIVLHGVYAWVSEANRQAIATIARRWLRPGGLLYVGYMSQPGAAPMAAMQKLMRLAAERRGGSAAQRVRAGLDLLQRLRRGGAGCFAEVPGLAQQLDHMEAEDPRSLVHEFLGQHWEPQHVADVMRNFARAGCRFVGSATPLENIDRVSVPGDALPAIRDAGDPAIAETLRDLARHQSLRRDLYQRTDADADGGTAPGADAWALDPQAHREALLALRLEALPGAPPRGPLTLATRVGPVTLPAVLVDPLLEALATGPQHFAELARHPTYAPQPGLLSQLFQILLSAGQAHPPQPRPVEPRPAQALNRLLCAPGQPFAGWLAAPALGTALPATPLQRWAAQALLREPALAGEALWHAVVRAAAEDASAPAPRSDELAAALKRFEQQELPRWRRWGVVPGAT